MCLKKTLRKIFGKLHSIKNYNTDEKDVSSAPLMLHSGPKGVRTRPPELKSCAEFLNNPIVYSTEKEERRTAPPTRTFLCSKLREAGQKKRETWRG